MSRSLLALPRSFIPSTQQAILAKKHRGKVCTAQVEDEELLVVEQLEADLEMSR